MQSIQATPGDAVRLWRDAALQGACLTSARYGAHEFERHVHDELVITVTEHGAGRCETRAGSDVAGPATVWIFQPGEYHGGRVWDDRCWTYRGIYLDRTGLDSLAGVFAQDDDKDDARGMSLKAGLHRDPQLARLLLQAHRSIENAASHLERQARWWAALGLLFGRYGEIRPRPENIGPERAKMGRVRDYLAVNHARNVSIEELSGLCGLSRFHLMRAFAREYGLPPHAYANQLRLAEAKRLIAAGHGLSQAATEAGFYDQSHLARLFKRAYDITPGAYARLHEVAAAPSSLEKSRRGAFFATAASLPPAKGVTFADCLAPALSPQVRQAARKTRCAGPGESV